MRLYATQHLAIFTSSQKGSYCRLLKSLTIDAYQDCSPGPLGGIAEHCDVDNVPIAKVSDLIICQGKSIPEGPVANVPELEQRW